MWKKIIGFGALGIAVTAGSFAGYKLATDEDLRKKIQEKVTGAFAVSKDQLSGMSEDVAVKRAQLTRNPQINRDWVENQWEALNN
ncbi:MAG: hypothetical protein E7001_03405 [Coriobacteriaceae bacterium]|nr:hypothetical protein [Coriobacteriaceae bacterium]